MISILAKTTNKKKGVLFVEPYIDSKDTLSFTDNSINVKSYYKLGSNSIEVGLNKTFFSLEIEEEDIEILNNFHKEEYMKINKFFHDLATKKVSIWISKLNEVSTKELIDNKFSEYYLKTFNYQINGILKTKLETFEDIQKEIIKRVDLSKYNISNNEYGDFYIIPLKDIK